jgi:hypothetical protein
MRLAHNEAEEKKWDEEWEALGQEIDKAWKSKKSALEILSELRR